CRSVEIVDVEYHVIDPGHLYSSVSGGVALRQRAEPGSLYYAGRSRRCSHPTSIWTRGFENARIRGSHQTCDIPSRHSTSASPRPGGELRFAARGASS